MLKNTRLRKRKKKCFVGCATKSVMIMFWTSGKAFSAKRSQNHYFFFFSLREVSCTYGSGRNEYGAVQCMPTGTSDATSRHPITFVCRTVCSQKETFESIFHFTEHTVHPSIMTKSTTKASSPPPQQAMGCSLPNMSLSRLLSTPRMSNNCLDNNGSTSLIAALQNEQGPSFCGKRKRSLKSILHEAMVLVDASVADQDLFSSSVGMPCNHTGGLEDIRHDNEKFTAKQ